MFFFICPGHVLRFILDQVMHQLTACSWWFILHHRPIGLPDLFALEHLIEPCQCFACPGKKNNTAHGPVDTVNRTNEYFAGLIVFFLDVLLYEITERSVT